MVLGRKYDSREIHIDEGGVSAQSAEVKKRLDRIERNYSALELIFDDLESRIELDDRLVAASILTSTDLPRKPR